MNMRICIFFAVQQLVSSTENWKLVWADEFDGTQVDTDKWNFENGDGCPHLCGWGNNELQWYQEENAAVINGHLIIEAKNEIVEAREFTSSKLITKGKEDWKFGKIEVKALLPTGMGIWPAIWMLPTNQVKGTWPRSGEIDIMELVGKEPSKVYMTAHFGEKWDNKDQLGGSYVLPNEEDFSGEFHTFSVEWSKDRIEWFVDGNSKFSATQEQVTADGRFIYPFNEEFYLILNVAVGGYWPGNPDNSTQFPQHMKVDYVRFYQKHIDQ